jgi:L-threonylcarbamoyladenylate synthase
MEIYRINPDAPNKTVVTECATILKNGGVIAHPTETIYGFAANIYNEDAVRKIYEIKGRRTAKPLSLMVDSIETIEKIVGEISPFARKVMEHFLPGPLTVVLPFNKPIDIPFFSDRKTVGFRIPDYPFCLELLKEIKLPLTTTSANKSGLKNPQLAVEVMAQFNTEIDILVDGGKTKNGLPSTVIDLSDNKITILREGAISAETLNDFV